MHQKPARCHWNEKASLIKASSWVEQPVQFKNTCTEHSCFSAMPNLFRYRYFSYSLLLNVYKAKGKLLKGGGKAAWASFTVNTLSWVLFPRCRHVYVQTVSHSRALLQWSHFNCCFSSLSKNEIPTHLQAQAELYRYMVPPLWTIAILRYGTHLQTKVELYCPSTLPRLWAEQLRLSAKYLRHVEVLLLGKQQGIQALLEVAGAVAVGPRQGKDDIKKIQPSKLKIIIYI